MADLLFELRCEELPPRDLRTAATALEAALRTALEERGLPPSGTSSAWTPRRIALWAHGLPDRSADREERVRGPRAAAAFDAEGRPTRALEGFARKHGLAPADVERDGDSVVAVVRTPGRPASEVLAEVLPGLPPRAPWRKSMRWGAPVTFARPIRGVVALLGGEVVPCEVAGLAAGRTTTGHPFLASGPVEIETAARIDYLARLRSAYVVADPEERRAGVLTAARDEVPGLEPREALLEEVTNLVEWPTALTGRFDRRFLDLPPRLLVTVMEHHQRFFPVRGEDGALRPEFVAVLDRDRPSVDVARPGFERVLVPRLHDASFFFREDRKKRLEDRLDALSGVVYHRRLGTLRDKAERLERIAGEVAGLLGHGAEERALAARAGRLAKCDLVTLMVGEFPELQGHVGSVYARQDGEPEAVCAAIDVQYRHDFAGGEPLARPALALALAENLDVLCAFGTRVGLPSGSADPFGVRRAAITLVELCELEAPDLPILDALSAAGGDEAAAAYLEARVRSRHRDAGERPDHLDAVRTWRTVGEFRGRLADLRALSEMPFFDRLLEVAERCRNITRKIEAGPAEARAELLREPAEKALFEVWRGVRDTLTPAPAPLSRAEVVQVAEALAEPLHRFFDEVFVNVDDPAVRDNRHALLREIDAALLRFADLCRIVRPAR